MDQRLELGVINIKKELCNLENCPLKGVIGYLRDVRDYASREQGETSFRATCRLLKLAQSSRGDNVHISCKNGLKGPQVECGTMELRWREINRP